MPDSLSILETSGGSQDDSSESTSQPALGRSLRAIRRERGYSLAEVAAAIDISSSFLSLVENGKSDITIGRLMRAADFYDVRVTDLLSTRPGERGVVRRDERTMIGSLVEGVDIGLLTPDTRRKLMPTLTTIAPGKAATEHLSHEGEEFIHVLHGTVEIDREDTERITLSEGDSIIFECSISHSYRNPGHVAAHLIVVISPPIF